MILRFGLIATFFLALTINASAQWVGNVESSEFVTWPTSNAFVESREYNLGFRCQLTASLLVFVTPERVVDENATYLMNKARPLLKLRIDGGQIFVLAAGADLASNSNLQLTAIADREVVNAVREAKSRITVVISINGDLYHEIEFTASGSTEAIDTLLKGCGVFNSMEEVQPKLESEVTVSSGLSFDSELIMLQRLLAARGDCQGVDPQLSNILELKDEIAARAGWNDDAFNDKLSAITDIALKQKDKNLAEFCADVKSQIAINIYYLRTRDIID